METGLHCTFGGPILGRDSWPRPEVVDRLFDALMSRNGCRMFGLRLIGKSSVFLDLERRLRARHGLTVISINLQGICCFKDFLGALLREIPATKFAAKARRFVARIPLLNTLAGALVLRFTRSKATDFGGEFERHAAWAGDIGAALNKAGPVVLILDELPIMLRNMMADGYKPADAERFLATLGRWRDTHGVRLLLSGSIGLAQVARTHGVAIGDWVGGLPQVPLPPLSRSEAIGMVDALARGQGLTDWTTALSEAVVDASDETWPIFLRHGFDAAVRAKARTPAEVVAAVQRDARRALADDFYQQFFTRLARYGRKQIKAARIILKAATAEPVPFAVVDKQLTKSGAFDLRDDLLDALCEDDFIVIDTEARTLRAASKLVPIWVRSHSWGC